MFIGKRLKELREEKNLTLKELSEKSGVQIATLSRIENHKMTGTLESHMNIARALGVELVELYQEISARKESRAPEENAAAPESFVYNDKASYEILTGRVLSKKMMPVILKIEIAGRTNTESGPAGSERFVFVLEGTVTVVIEGKTWPLSKNSTLYFDASLPHHFENTGAQPARVISVITPVVL